MRECSRTKQSIPGKDRLGRLGEKNPSFYFPQTSCETYWWHVVYDKNNSIIPCVVSSEIRMEEGSPVS